MTLEQTKKLAIELMTEHGLWQQGWGFGFDRAKKRLGCCHFRKKLITVSIGFISINEESVIKNTILHEIAHALVGGHHGHDHVWQKKAIEIGCDGKRCASLKEIITPKMKYTAVCPQCGYIHHRSRVPKHRTSCGACSRVFNPNAILEYEKNY